MAYLLRATEHTQFIDASSGWFTFSSSDDFEFELKNNLSATIFSDIFPIVSRSSSSNTRVAFATSGGLATGLIIGGTTIPLDTSVDHFAVEVWKITRTSGSVSVTADGVEVLAPTANTSTPGGDLNWIWALGNGFNRGNVGDFYYLKFSKNGTLIHHWDADASGGTGEILPDIAGTLDASLSNPNATWPADDSEWVFYSSGGTDNLLADDVESATEVSSPAIGQTHALTSVNVESISETSSPAITQEHALTADDAQSASEVSSPAITEVYSLAADDVESSSEVTQPAITQVHNLAANDVESSSEITQPAIGQDHQLTSVDISSLSEVTQPTLSTAANVDPLSANDVESASEVTSPTIAQVHVLTPVNVDSNSQVGVPALGQVHVLTATDIESASSVSSPTIRNPDESLAQPITNTRATVSETRYRVTIDETNYRIEVA